MIVRRDDGKSGSPDEPRMRTQLIHGQGRSKKWDYDHHVVPPMTASATFRLDSAERGARGFVDFGHIALEEAEPQPIYIYDRLDEPTRAMLEENLAYAERGEMALCFASGMAAISATVGTLLQTGQNLVAHRLLYGCTYSLFVNWLPRLGMEARFVDLTDPKALEQAVDENTRVVYFETPVNPEMTLIDIAAISKAVAKINANRAEVDKVRVVVDNTFASPFCQRPIELGADIVCMSLTKGIGGFGTDIGGAVVGPRWLHDPMILYRKDFGGSLSPKAAWQTLVFGLPSLAARMANYQKSAHKIAKHLAEHPKVLEVHYPGLDSFPQFELAKRQMRDENGKFAPGSMLYFLVRGDSAGGEAGRRVVDWVAEHSYCITLAVSLGQIKTLIESPWSMTHATLPDAVKRERGLHPGGVRLSVGLEDWRDVLGDLERALETI